MKPITHGSVPWVIDTRGWLFIRIVPVRLTPVMFSPTEIAIGALVGVRLSDTVAEIQGSLVGVAGEQEAG